MSIISNAVSYFADGTIGTIPAVREVDENGVCAVYVSLVGEAPLSADAAAVLTIQTPKTIRGCMANVLYLPHWCRPTFFTDFTAIPKDTQALLWQQTDGEWTLLFPLVGEEYVCSLISSEGKLTAVLRSFTDMLTDCDTLAFVCATGSDPHELFARCAKAGARLMGRPLPLRQERRYPEIFEYLGFCSWDSMEIWVNEEELLQKCAELREKRIPVRWTIIDDMWADVEWTKELPRFTPHTESFPVMHASRLRDLEADPLRFPHGLADCIRRMREEYGMEVGIWHPTPGYWAGLVKDSPADQKLAGLTLTVPSGRIEPNLADSELARRYYSTMHAFFKECGASFVKVDNQSFLRDTYRGVLPVGQAARNLHAGIEDSVQMHFDGALINCMGMATENMLNRSHSAISRCSGDFQPENKAWFAKHLLQCAYNGLTQGQFYYNDWDMWWSDDGQAKKNSVLRALSGGPIYVSDRMGRSRPEIFEPLCFTDGRILRPDNVAVPTADCLCTDPTVSGRIFKVFNMAVNTAYVAAFNLHAEEIFVEGTLSPAEIPGLFGERFLLYEYFSGKWEVLSREAAHAVTLRDGDDYRLYSLTPICDGVAVVGDVSKFISIRAVTAQTTGFLRVVEGGILKVYSEKAICYAENQSAAPLTVLQDGDLYTIFAKDGDCEIHYG